MLVNFRLSKPYIAEEIITEPVRDITPAAIETSALPVNIDSLSSTLKEAGDVETLRQAWDSIGPEYKQLDPASQKQLKDLKDKFKRKLEAAAAPEVDEL